MKKNNLKEKAQKNKNQDVLDKHMDVKAIIQNTNVNVEINPSELASIAKINQDLAREYLEVILQNNEHVRQIENGLINIEKDEQKIRIKESDANIKYSGIGQWLAFVVILSCLGIVAYAVYTEQTAFSITSVISTVILGLYHISGRNKK
ncbi:hypothetical protein CPIN18021_0262 [Campylobacter pinnipediorum subsp. caledonicus]|uniref:DUF2335 domain-containing protein n=1 Tax=Campylobacter pinnipediorum subsp. caledonicus TaxID=1874362 RepID=A0A1S6U5Z2_9BACT|nr:hypothetical protein [Campylobacter pinnipediorum]AQW87109.1 hypothetical protein CPIN18021_0262 [Campylobacter pinnipediorum subsp. caledonicus]